MTPTNPRAVTIKLPRKRLTQIDQNHMLDIALACSCMGNQDPSNHAERKEFEHHIKTSKEVNPKLKEVLASLTEEEKAQLFC